MLAPFVLGILCAAPVLTPELGFGAPAGLASGDQQWPRAAVGSAGTLLVWTDTRAGENDEDVWGALLTDGPSGTQSQSLSIAVGGDVERYVAVAFGAGKFFVTWHNYSQDRVLGRFYQPDGTPEGPAFIVDFRAGDSMDVAFDGTSFIAVWNSFNWTTDHDVKMAEVGPGGTVVTRLLSNAPSSQVAPAVACDGARHCLVAWEDNRNNTLTGTDLWGTRVDDGLPLDPNGKDLFEGPANQYQPSVAWAPSNWLVTWYDESTQDVGAHRYDTGAARLGGAFTLVGTTSNDSQARVVSFGSGYLAVFASGSDIYAQRFDAAGSPVDPAPKRVCPASVWYAAQPVAASPPGGSGALVLWQDKRFEQKDLFGAHLDLALDPKEDGGFPAAFGGMAQGRPRVATDGSGYLAVWVEDGYRQGKRIMGAQVDAAGAMVGAPIAFSAPATADEYPNGWADVAYSSGRYLVVWEGRSASGRAVVMGRSFVPGTGLVESAPLALTNPDAPEECTPSVGGSTSGFLIAYESEENVKAQRLTAAAATTGPELLVGDSAFGIDLFAVRGVGDGFVVGWIDQDPNDWVPRLGRVAANGATPDAPLGVSPLGPGFAGGYAAALACHDAGCLLVWDKDSDLNGQVFDAQLSPRRASPVVVSRAGSNQRRAALAWEQNGWLVAWEDTRSSTTVELWGAHVDPAGNVLEPAGIPIAAEATSLREVALAAVSNSKALLAYSRLDLSPGVDASRVKVRALVDATDGSVCAFSPDGTACNGTGGCAGGLCVGGNVTTPGFSSTPGVFLTCSEHFAYNADNRPLVVGPGTPEFSIAPLPGDVLPEGLTVDAATGALGWTPTREQGGQHHVVLIARGSGWAAAQTLELNVECAERRLAVGCSCDAGGGALGLWLFAAVLLRRRRR